MAFAPNVLAVDTVVRARYQDELHVAVIKRVDRSLKFVIKLVHDNSQHTINEGDIVEPEVDNILIGSKVWIKKLDKLNTDEATVVKILDISKYYVAFHDRSEVSLNRSDILINSGNIHAGGNTLEQLLSIDLEQSDDLVGIAALRRAPSRRCRQSHVTSTLDAATLVKKESSISASASIQASEATTSQSNIVDNSKSESSLTSGHSYTLRRRNKRVVEHLPFSLGNLKNMERKKKDEKSKLDTQPKYGAESGKRSSPRAKQILGVGGDQAVSKSVFNTRAAAKKDDKKNETIAHKVEYLKGQLVMVEWEGDLYPCKVLEKKLKPGKLTWTYHVHWIGWDKCYDSWESSQCIKRKCTEADIKKNMDKKKDEHAQESQLKSRAQNRSLSADAVRGTSCIKVVPTKENKNVGLTKGEPKTRIQHQLSANIQSNDSSKIASNTAKCSSPQKKQKIEIGEDREAIFGTNANNLEAQLRGSPRRTRSYWAKKIAVTPKVITDKETNSTESVMQVEESEFEDKVDQENVVVETNKPIMDEILKQAGEEENLKKTLTPSESSPTPVLHPSITKLPLGIEIIKLETSTASVQLEGGEFEMRNIPNALIENIETIDRVESRVLPQGPSEDFEINEYEIKGSEQMDEVSSQELINEAYCTCAEVPPKEESAATVNVELKSLESSVKVTKYRLSSLQLCKKIVMTSSISSPEHVPDNIPIHETTLITESGSVETSRSDKLTVQNASDISIIVPDLMAKKPSENYSDINDENNQNLVGLFETQDLDIATLKPKSFDLSDHGESVKSDGCTSEVPDSQVKKPSQDSFELKDKMNKISVGVEEVQDIEKLNRSTKKIEQLKLPQQHSNDETDVENFEIPQIENLAAIPNRVPETLDLSNFDERDIQVALFLCSLAKKNKPFVHPRVNQLPPEPVTISKLNIASHLNSPHSNPVSPLIPSSSTVSGRQSSPPVSNQNQNMKAYQNIIFSPDKTSKILNLCIKDQKDSSGKNQMNMISPVLPPAKKLKLEELDNQHNANIQPCTHNRSGHIDTNQDKGELGGHKSPKSVSSSPTAN